MPIMGMMRGKLGLKGANVEEPPACASAFSSSHFHSANQRSHVGITSLSSSVAPDQLNVSGQAHGWMMSQLHASTCRVQQREILVPINRQPGTALAGKQCKKLQATQPHWARRMLGQLLKQQLQII